MNFVFYTGNPFEISIFPVGGRPELYRFSLMRNSIRGGGDLIFFLEIGL